MSVVNPSSAVIAKAKSKYGKRLTLKDYNALIKCESIGEIVQYLRSYTYYQGFLGKVSNDIHRGNLENILRGKLFDSFLSLCRYNSDKSPVTTYILRKAEDKEIIRFITLLSTGKAHEYIFDLPMYFNEHTDISLERLSKVRSYQELMSVLDKTIYKKIFEKFPPDADGKYRIATIDDAIDTVILDELYKSINHIKSKKDKTQLLALFDTLTDYDNYSRILRLKRYYNLPNDVIREHLIPYGKLSKKIDSILSKESYEEVRDALAQTPIGRKARRYDIDGEMLIQGRFEVCRHEMYFSSNPEIVLLAYYIVSNTELRNIITIIEGVRYSMEPDKIKEMLIF